MIVPEYWAEAREQVRHRRRVVTVRRFGWSDAGQAAAQAHAEARVREAMAAILAGEDRPRRERRTNYGVEGVPIREQVVARHGDAIVTRNSYGARCLNTPDVLFADVDFAAPEQAVGGLVVAIVVAMVIGGSLAWNLVGVWAALGVVLLVLVGGAFAASAVGPKDDGPEAAEARAQARVDAFSEQHPDWHLRVYRTPAGLRLLAMHRTFSPQEEAVAALFHALQADRLYATMCRVQHCFRARLTAKPWRIGITERIRPTVAAWSAEQASLPGRVAWIDAYERIAHDHAACAFVRAVGDTGRVDAKAEAIRALHDDAAGAYTGLPLA